MRNRENDVFGIFWDETNKSMDLRNELSPNAVVYLLMLVIMEIMKDEPLNGTVRSFEFKCTL